LNLPALGLAGKFFLKLEINKTYILESVGTIKIKNVHSVYLEVYEILTNQIWVKPILSPYTISMKI